MVEATKFSGDPGLQQPHPPSKSVEPLNSTSKRSISKNQQRFPKQKPFLEVVATSYPANPLLSPIKSTKSLPVLHLPSPPKKKIPSLDSSSPSSLGHPFSGRPHSPINDEILDDEIDDDACSNVSPNFSLYINNKRQETHQSPVHLPLSSPINVKPNSIHSTPGPHSHSLLPISNSPHLMSSSRTPASSVTKSLKSLQLQKKISALQCHTLPSLSSSPTVPTLCSDED